MVKSGLRIVLESKEDRIEGELGPMHGLRMRRKLLKPSVKD